MSMNNYRNAHHRLNHEAKMYYKELLTPQILKCKRYTKVELVFTLYPPTRRKLDVDNHGAVTAKFLQDALVGYGVLEDDHYLYIPKLTFQFGKVDKENPRVDVEIIPIEEIYESISKEK